MDREGGVFEPGGPWWRSRVGIAILAAFAGPVFLLLLRGPATVPLIYAALFVEGDVVAYLALQKARFSSGEKIAGVGSKPKRGDKMFLSKERLGELAWSLKRAETGSEDSRRQVARDIAPLIGHWGGRSGLSGEGLSKALEDAVYPYLDDRTLKTEMGEAYAEEARVRGAMAIVGRTEYVTALETILSELEREGSP